MFNFVVFFIYSNQVSWVAEIKRNEIIYGHVSSPVTQIFPHLRDQIWKSNNATTFHPVLLRPDLKRRFLNCGRKIFQNLFVLYLKVVILKSRITSSKNAGQQ